MTSPKSDKSEAYQVDHLFLLIGENPLPNYVAAKCLLKEGGTAYLVHSANTVSKADKLSQMLKPITTEFISLAHNEEADSYHIREKITTKIDTILKQNSSNQALGLNYTGGTKAMSVHSYLTLLNTQRVKNPVFSYLDTRSLQILRDRENDTPQPQPVDVKVSLKELFNLHDLRWEKEPVKKPVLPELAEKFAKLHVDRNIVISWRWWCDNVLIPATKFLREKPGKPPEWKWRKDNQIDKVRLKYNIAVEDLNQYIEKYLNPPKESDSTDSFLKIFQKENYKIIKELSELYNSLWNTEYLPHLEKINQIFYTNNYLDESKIDLSLQKFADDNSMGKSKYAAEWLNGLWLEDYVLYQVQEIVTRFPGLIHDSGMSFKVKFRDEKKEKFEFDVAFMKDYQLFALSCTTDYSKSLCKSKLFEAYIRARQLGGDEARVALICFYDDIKELEKELKIQVSVKVEDPKIVVFGCEHLENLHTHIEKWIDRNNSYYKL